MVLGYKKGTSREQEGTKLDVKVVPLGWIIGQKRNKLCKKGTSQREREQVKRTKLTIQVQYKKDTSTIQGGVKRTKLVGRIDIGRTHDRIKDVRSTPH